MKTTLWLASTLVLSLLLGHTAPAADLTPPSLRGADLRVQDVCVGNGTAGPYSLSWTHLTPQSETVRVDGLLQTRELDYTLDADGGTVTFTHGLSARSAAQITYARDPALSQRSGGGGGVPLSLNLLRGEHSYLSLSAVGGPAQDAQRAMTLGVGMGWHGTQSNQLASHFYYTPVAAGGSSPVAVSRTGLSLAGTAGAGNWGSLSFGLARAGAGLGDTGDGSLRAGTQSLTLNGKLTPTKQMQAHFDYALSTPTDGAAGTGGAGATARMSLGLTLSPSDRAQVSATYDGTQAAGRSGDSQTAALKAVVSPTKTLSLETSVTEARVDAETTDRQTLTVSLSPRSAVKLDAGIALRQTGGGGRDSLGTAVASVGGTVRPLPGLEFSGRYESRLAPAGDTDPNDTLDTGTATVTLAAGPSLHLVGTYAQNPDAGDDTLQRLARRGIGVETTLGAVGFSGGYDWSRRFDTPAVDESVRADLSVRCFGGARLSVGYAGQLSARDAATPLCRTYSVGFTQAMGDSFRLSLSGKRAQSAVAPPAYDASANLGMKF